MSRTPCLREFLARLKDYGVVLHPDPARGRGSELLVYRPDPKNPQRGPRFLLTNHGMGKDVLADQIASCLRRFAIEKREFFKGM